MSERYQPAFGGGEISPILYGRTDLARYGMSLKTLRNFIVLPQGGVVRRPGTEVVGLTKATFDDVRMVPFQYNYQQAYVLEFGENYFRIIKDGAYVVEVAKVITGITKANPGVVTSAAHGFSTGDYIYFAGIVGMTELNGRTFLVGTTTANTFNINSLGGGGWSTASYTTYVSGGTVARLKTVTTTYQEEELPQVKVGTAQSADVMTVCHDLHAPAEVVRGSAGDYDFSISTITFEPQVDAPTGVFVTQEYQYAITGTTLAVGSTKVTTSYSAGSRLNYGDTIYIKNIVGTTELNNRWFIILDKVLSTPTAVLRIGTTAGEDIDSSGYTAWSSGGNIYTEEVIRYKVTAVSDTGEESLASAIGSIAYSLAPSVSAPISIKWTPPSQTCTSFNIYKEKNGVYGYIGSRSDVAELLASPITIVAPTATITGITQANPGVVTTSAAHQWVTNDKVVLSGVSGMTEVNGNTYTIIKLSSTTFSIGVNSTGYGAYTSGGTATGKGITQNNPAVVTATAHGFVNGDRVYLSGVSGMTEMNGFTHRVANKTANTFELNYLSGGNLDSSAYTAWTSGGTVSKSPYWFIDDNIEADLINVAPPSTADNPFNATGKYPAVTCFHEQRRMFARTNNDIQSVRGTQIGNIYNMNQSTPLKADDAVNFTLPSTQANEIRHMVPLTDLSLVGGSPAIYLFTGGSEWISTGNDAGYTIENIRNRIVSGIGSAEYPAPMVVAGTILFPVRTGNRVWDVGYRLEGGQSPWGEDRTIYSEHLFDGKQIVDWCYQHNPLRCLWCVLDDGTLAAMTYLPEHQIYAWSRHDTPDGKFKSCACIPEGDEDVVYFAVERLGVTWTERLRSPTFDDLKDAFYVDFGITYDSPVDMSGAAAANPVVITTSSAHGLTDGDYVDVSDVVGMTELNGNRYRAGKLTSTTFSLVTQYPSADVTITGITQASPAVVTAPNHGFSNGNTIRITGVIGMTAVNGVSYTVASATTNTFALSGINSTGYDAYISGGAAYIYPPADKTITGIVNFGVAAVTSAAHGFSNGNIVYISGVLGMTEVNGRLFIVADAATNTFTLKDMAGTYVDSTAYGVYTSGGVIYLHTYINGSSYTAYEENGKIREAISTVYPVSHLNGQAVTYLADGAVNTGTVTNDTLTLAYPASRIHIGHAYTSELETLDMNDPGGRMTGKKRSAAETNSRFYRTRGGIMGADDTNTKDIKHEYDEDTMLSTGEIRMVANPTWEKAARVYIAQEEPLPMTIQSILTSFKAGEL